MKLAIQSGRLRQRGAATLVVVMMLFLVMALLAAYANRSLLFEQRVAGSYFRASLSQEVAEGGIEWALAQLNGVAVDGACTPVDTGGQRFAARYLDINATDRSLTAKASRILADCARDLGNEGWACRCPAPDVARTAPAAVASELLTPSFGLRMEAGGRGGTLQLKVLGCTDSVVDQCDRSVGDATLIASQNQLAKSRLSALVGLVGAVRNPPAAPLIVKGNLDTSGTGGLGLHNTDPRSAGLLFAIGGAASGLVDERLESVPGTAPSLARVEGDATLLATTGSDIFKMFMGASPSRYVQHPSLRQVTCAGDCAGALETAYKAGKRIIWVNGDLEISSNKILGTVDDPVLVIATGTVLLSGSFQLNGMLVSGGKLTWTNPGGLTSLVTGIVLAQGAMETSGRVDIFYQQAIADQLRNRMGSYVRVSGGWIDTSD